MDWNRMDIDYEKLKALAWSFLVNLFGALVMALFIVGGIYIGVTYAGMDYQAAAGVMALLTTPVFSALPASVKGLTTAFVDFIWGFLDQVPKTKKKDDSGSLTPLGYIVLALVLLVIAGGVIAVYYYKIDLWALAAGGVLLLVGLVGGSTVKAKPKPTGVTLKDGIALINWDLFDKTRVHVQGILPEMDSKLLHITFTADGKSWEAMDCRYNPEDGYIYSLKADPTADNLEGMKNDVYLQMDKLAAPKALDYILEKIQAKGFDTKTIKAVLVLGRPMVAKMSAKDLDDYIRGVNPEVNLEKGWAKHLQRDEYFLRREADDLYWKYYK